ncbi:hypothetical protein ACLOAV_006058 [Pseudogymnoascus australis]
MQSELLKAYADFVHSQMPIIDLEEFLLVVNYMNEKPNKQRTDSGGFQTSGGKQISFFDDSRRTFKIKLEDCRIDLLNVEDFDLDENKLNHESVSAVKMRADAVLCVER